MYSTANFKYITNTYLLLDAVNCRNPLKITNLRQHLMKTNSHKQFVRLKVN